MLWRRKENELTFTWEVLEVVRGSRSEVVVGQKMPKRCVAAGCSNVSNLKEGISLHKLPFYDDDRPEAKKRRKKWVDFIRLKRMKWQPSQSSVLCSEHFRREDFVRSANLGDEQNLDIAKRWLRTDDFGVCVFPSVHAKALVPNPNDKPASNRAKRMVRCVRLYRSWCTAVYHLSFSLYTTLLKPSCCVLDH